jgi:hypothetical protein
MATNTSAELGAAFDCTICDCDGGLEEFEPEAQRSGLAQRNGPWLRVASPSDADVRRWQPYVAPPRARAWPIVVVPVVVAAAIAGGVASWLGTQANERVLVPAPRVAATGTLAGGSGARDTGPAQAEMTVAPAVPAAIVVASAPPPAPPAPLDPAFERTLAAISQSYRTLDASALATVWPGADITSLASTFAELKYQSLAFDRCQLRPNGDAGAVASCEVSIAAASKSGDPTLLRRRESWTLVMDRSGDRWTVAGLSVR